MRTYTLESTLRKSQGSGRAISAWSGLLAIGALILGALPAQAQSWQVQYQNGNAIVPDIPNGPYPLGGTITNTGQLGGNYAAAQAYIQSNPSSVVGEAYQVTPSLNTVVPGTTDMISINAIIESGFYGPNNLLYNGTLKGTVTGQLRAYWKWTYPQGNIPPKSINLLLSTYLGGSAAGTAYTSEGVRTSGLSADITLTDEVNGTGFNETAAAWEGDNGVKGSTLGGWIPDIPCHSSVVSGTHLVTAQVDPVTGLAEVYLNGQITYSLSDSLSNWSDDACEIDGNISASAQLISANIQGYSTHCAPSLHGYDPNWTSYQPHYFSGTGCEVDSFAVPASGHLTHAQLCIVDSTGKDQVVKEYWDTGEPGCPNPVPTDGSVVTGTNNTTGVSLKALFDSTHFQDGSMIVLKLKVWDSNTGYYDGQIQGPSYNKAYVLANGGKEINQDPPIYIGDFEDTYAQTLADISNYAVRMKHTPLSSAHDTKRDILNNILAETTFYINSHGFFVSSGQTDKNSGIYVGPGFYFGDCTLITSDVANRNRNLDLIIPGDISGILGLQNQLEIPPYNFVHMDTCHSGGDGSNNDTGIANEFGVNARKDCAFLGNVGEINGDKNNEQFSARVWQNMANQQTLWDAVVNSFNVAPLDNTVTFPNGKSVVYVAPVVVIGDNSMRLHGIYTGVAGNWFKSI